MATISKERIKAVLTLTDGPPAILHVLEGASQTYVRGEIGYRTGGYFEEITGNTPAVIYGVAAADGANDSDAETDNDVEVPVYLAAEGNVFEGNMLEAAAADHVLVASDLGTPMAIQRVTADGKVYLNAAVKAGTSVRVFVHKVAAGSAIGDTNARVLFTFLPNFVQHLGTS